MSFDCQIAGAMVVTAQERFPATIAIADGLVAGLLTEPSSRAARTIDADGLVALPGMVDQHVHFMDPGDSAREDFIHGTSAAAAGGVTTVIEHTHSNPVLSAQDLREKAAYLVGRSVVDYGLTAHVFPDTIDVPALWEAGAAMLKAFTCTTHGVPGLLADDLLRLFRSVAAVGARALVHCEDEHITEDNEEHLRAAHRSDFGVISEWRSSEAEAVAVGTVALLARLTGARVTIAHASQPSVVDLVGRERALGARLTIESCPQYFFLTADDVAEHGPTRKFTPPARPAPAGELMWERLARGEIDVLSSDHAPSTLEQKLAGDIWGCPFGLPGVETTLPMLLSAVAAGRLSLERLVETYSAVPARLLGLYPRKGALQPGSDADLVLVDPKRERVLRDRDVISKAGWTPYDGYRVTGVPVLTMVRGTVVSEDGKVTAEPGHGHLVGRGR